MRRLVIFGIGGFGRELVATGRRAVERGEYDALVFADDRASDPVMGHPVLSPNSLTCEDRMIFAVGSGEVRRRLAERFGGAFATLVDPRAIVGPDVELGEGTVLCPLAVVTASARIGRHFQGNCFSLVSHDCTIGDFVTFAPRATCNGTVEIGDGVYVGAGAIIRNGTPDRPMRIGAGATIGMGAVVTKEVPAGATVVGNPARPLAAR